MSPDQSISISLPINFMIDSNQSIPIADLKVKIKELDAIIEKGEMAKDDKKHYEFVLKDYLKKDQGKMFDLTEKKKTTYEIVVEFLKPKNGELASADSIYKNLIEKGSTMQKSSFYVLLGKWAKDPQKMVKRIQSGQYVYGS